MLKRFPALFSQEGEGQERSAIAENFITHFGWLSNAKMVSEFEGVPLEQVWNIGAIQFLNDLLYIKFKNEYDADQYKQSTAASIR